jgi:hypothetical protein
VTQFESVAQLTGHVAAPEQTKGEHEGAPVAPAGRILQVPSEVAPKATVQASQLPEHAELQQTPSAQNPDAH